MTRVDDCGAPGGQGHIIRDFTDPCAQAANQCAAQPATSPTGQAFTILSTQIQGANGAWTQGPVTCTATAAPPGIPAEAVHDAFVKLVPHPGIRTAPPNTRALVNLETLLWLDTTPTVNLGTTPLLGHQITITATVQSVVWTFGDGHTETTTNPGRPFTDADHCATVTCPDWFGHIYTATATTTISATVTWAGRYTADNGPSQPIAGTVTSPPLTTPLQILQSRTVLVPNPTR